MKKLVLTFLSFLAVSCGLKAHADSNCGDPSKGKYTCDTDQISIEYYNSHVTANGWSNLSATGDQAFIFGPGIDLASGVGRFKEKSVHASVPVSAEGGRGAYPCTAATANVGMLLYNVELTASNQYGSEIVLDSKKVYRTWHGFPGQVFNYAGLPEVCIFGISIPGSSDASPPSGYDHNWAIMMDTKFVNLSSSRIPSTYKNFQIKFKNVHPSVRNNGLSPLKAEESSLFISGAAAFLNINGFR